MDYNIFLLSVQDKVDKEDLSTLKLKFKPAKQKSIIRLDFCHFKKPIKPLIVSIICGFVFLLGS